MNVNLTNLWNRVKKDPALSASYAILLIASVGMFGSLYYSNYGDPISNLYSRDIFPIGEGFPPCKLCWYARILLYPMVPISLIAILKKEKNFIDYLLPLSVLGVLLTGYHSFLQWFPAQIAQLGGNCDIINPCNVSQVTYLNFITIPFLGFVAFVLITALLIAAKSMSKTSA